MQSRTAVKHCAMNVLYSLQHLADVPLIHLAAMLKRSDGVPAPTA
jgi:hypothetical protein